ncbi:MAG: hypothetical protein E7016_03810 [Alphaproteobacteria bacterium]|nr:hypothetical protein [Alphaproteobacteria bacterium]
MGGQWWRCLGVLAIIGVLSVGGIAGYSKAMFKNKMTKLTTGIYYLADNLDLIFSHDDYGINDLSSIIVKMNIVPDGFTVKNPNSNSPQLIDPFGHNVSSNITLPHSQKTVVALYINKVSYDVCVNFLSQSTWENRDLVFLGVNHTSVSPENTAEYAQIAMFYVAENINYIGNVNRAVELCTNSCKSKSGEEGYCYISLQYYITRH